MCRISFCSTLVELFGNIHVKALCLEALAVKRIKSILGNGTFGL
jgi:hypothetical protein